MIDLFFFLETITNNYKIEVLNILSILTIISAIYVIINKNPIISILFLIGLFAGISTYLILIGLNFIGLSYLIIYIGAVSILFLFILMLINIRISELQNNNNNSILFATMIIIILSYSIFQVLPYSVAITNNYAFGASINQLLYNLSGFKYLTFCQAGLPIKQPLPYLHNVGGLNEGALQLSLEVATESSNIFFATSNDWNGNLIDTNHISNIGNILYTNYNIWLIITSFILLLSMIGAIVITIKKK